MTYDRLVYDTVIQAGFAVNATAHGTLVDPKKRWECLCKECPS